MRMKYGMAKQWFFEHVDDDTDECVVMPYGVSNGNRYGRFVLDGKRVKAHQLACEMAHGPAPEDKPFALHKCPAGGNPACINGRHLAWGNWDENSKDRIGDGTSRSGPKHNRAKFTWEQVAAIRAAWAEGATMKSLADQYGVVNSCISNIVTGKSYKW